MTTGPQTRQTKADGRLIAVEGIDGSGKSTQVHLLEQWLRHGGLRVFKTEWNSSDVVKEITSKGKKKGNLTPTTFSLLHATDFDDRYERNILPLLHAGYWVLADRYVYTAYARDAVRGCHPAWIRRLYSFARKPDIVFYFQVPVDIAVNRILSGRPKLKFYEAGMDLDLSNDIFESYRIFQSKITKEYESMVRSDGFVVVDGSLAIEKQQRLVRDKISEMMPKEVAGKLTVGTGFESRAPR
jgi:dTMP kinase